VRTKGNQKPPAEKKKAKLHYGPLKETKAPALSLQFYKLLSGVVSFLTLPFVALLTPFFSLGRISGDRLKTYGCLKDFCLNLTIPSGMTDLVTPGGGRSVAKVRNPG
jgi:hypothetical protein